SVRVCRSSRAEARCPRNPRAPRGRKAWTHTGPSGDAQRSELATVRLLQRVHARPSAAAALGGTQQQGKPARPEPANLAAAARMVTQNGPPAPLAVLASSSRQVSFPIRSHRAARPAVPLENRISSSDLRVLSGSGGWRVFVDQAVEKIAFMRGPGRRYAESGYGGLEDGAGMRR